MIRKLLNRVGLFLPPKDYTYDVGRAIIDLHMRNGCIKQTAVTGYLLDYGGTLGYNVEITDAENLVDNHMKNKWVECLETGKKLNINDVSAYKLNRREPWLNILTRKHGPGNPKGVEVQ